jgi:hypothetical protein
MEAYKTALSQAIDLFNMCPGLEWKSCLKECASRNGIAFGDEMAKFIKWASKQ